MSAWWDEEHKLLLLSKSEFEALPDGEVLTCIDGTTAVKGTDVIDMDTRGFHLAYGVVGNHPLRLAFGGEPTLEGYSGYKEPPRKKIWDCKIGEVDAAKLPPGADGPMRRAIEKAYIELTGEAPQFIFSGWGAKLTPDERDILS